MIHSH